jgi:hypothetical protein
MRLAVLMAVLASIGSTIHAQSHGGSQAPAKPAPTAAVHGAEPAAPAKTAPPAEASKPASPTTSAAASKNRQVSATEAVARIAEALKAIGPNAPPAATPPPRSSRPVVRPAAPRYRLQWPSSDPRWRIVWADRDRITLTWVE